MRDTSEWYQPMVKPFRELLRASAEPQGGSSSEPQPRHNMSPKDFFSAELGLYFLAEHFPGAGVGALWALMSGYLKHDKHLVPVLRRLRLRMGDVGHSNYFLLCLNRYNELDKRVRGFATVEDSRRVVDTTVYERQDVSQLVNRWGHYELALAERVPYVAAATRDPASAGAMYEFTRRDRTIEVVRIPPAPQSLATAQSPVPGNLPSKEKRARVATRVSRCDLERTAAMMDAALHRAAERDPEAPKPYFQKFWKGLTDRVFEPGSDELIQPASIELDGITHEVGLMNSGKSTKALILAVNRVHAGWHVTLVVKSVMKVYETVSLLRYLGIEDVAPLIGRSHRADHVAAYWQSALADSPTTFPSRSDPAAVYANSVCLLEPDWRKSSNRPDLAPLHPDDYPCRGRLRKVDDDRKRPELFDCPFLSVCPTQAAENAVASARVWVTTPQGLVRSRATAMKDNMRWLEACQHHTDLIIVDEADQVQQTFDAQFLQSELLVSAETGWADSTFIQSLQGRTRQDRLPMQSTEVQRFCGHGRDLLEAVDELYSLLVADNGPSDRLRDVLDKTPFTGYSLLRRLTWGLHGLTYGKPTEDDADEKAETFLRKELSSIALDPFTRPRGGLEHAVEAVIGRYRSSSDVSAIDDWLVGHAPEQQRDSVHRRISHHRLLFQAAVWSSRITASFLEMSTLYPAVAEYLQLPDGDNFWQGQPPEDYQSLVPEAPMGNLMALQWNRKGSGFTGDLRLMWVRGVGRWLIHHLHDLLEPEGVAGPHVLLTSATSWTRHSSLYNIDIKPTTFVREPAVDREALLRSTVEFMPVLDEGGPVFVSGRLGAERDQALRRITTHLTVPSLKQPTSWLDHLRAELEPERRKVLFVTLSGDDAESSALCVNDRTTFSAHHVVPNDLNPGEFGLHLRQVHTFGKSDVDVLVAAELAIQRGHNILNEQQTAALGALCYLVRPHPPASDLSFPLSLMNRDAMRLLLSPAAVTGPLAAEARKLRKGSRERWHGLLGEQVIFRRLRKDDHRAFVANSLVTIYQTIGRTIRGGTTTRVYFCDAAFAPKGGPGRGSGAESDTIHTSLLLAIASLLREVLEPPRARATLETRRDHIVSTMLFELAHHLFTSIRWPEPERQRDL